MPDNIGNNSNINFNIFLVMKEQDGWTRGMYFPKEEGRYLVKNKSNEYYIFYFDGKEWEYKDDVHAWIEIPRTEIECPF